MSGHRQYFLRWYDDYLEKTVPRTLAQATRAAKFKALEKTIRHYLQYFPLVVVRTTHGEPGAPLAGAFYAVMHQLTDTLYYMKEGRRGYFYHAITLDATKVNLKKLKLDKCPFVQPHSPSSRSNFIGLLQQVERRILEPVSSRALISQEFFIAYYDKEYVPLQGKTLEEALRLFRKEFHYNTFEFSPKKRSHRICVIYDTAGTKIDIRAYCSEKCKSKKEKHEHALKDSALTLMPSKIVV